MAPLSAKRDKEKAPSYCSCRSSCPPTCRRVVGAILSRNIKHLCSPHRVHWDESTIYSSYDQRGRVQHIFLDLRSPQRISLFGAKGRKYSQHNDHLWSGVVPALKIHDTAHHRVALMRPPCQVRSFLSQPCSSHSKVLLVSPDSRALLLSFGQFPLENLAKFPRSALPFCCGQLGGSPGV